jgi:NitT/TauT family transport system substrate-binding protein
VGCGVSRPAAPAPEAPSPASAVAPAAGGAATFEPRRVTLAIAAKSLAFLPFYLGQEEGLYEAEGVQIEITPLEPRIAIAALTTGEIAYSSPVGSAIQAAIAGQPVKTVLSLFKGTVFSVVAAPDIATVADLRGKSVAVSNPTTTDAVALQAVLRAHGVAPTEINVLPAQAAGQRFTALVSGAVQAAALPPPFDAQAQRLGFHELAWTADYLHRSQAGLVTTDQRLRDQPDEVRRMIRATLRSIAYTIGHPAESVAFVTREFGVEANLAEQTYTKIAQTLRRDGDIDTDAVREEIAEDRARLGIDADVPVSQVLDLRLLREVQQELGVEP